MAEETNYLTVQDVADRLGVSVFTIRRYIRAGKLRAVKLDAAYRLSREDLGEFLKAREIGPALSPGVGEPAPQASARPAPETESSLAPSKVS